MIEIQRSVPFIDASMVKAQIARLLAAFPELREDDEALVLSLESETDAMVLCERLVRKIKLTEAIGSGIATYISDLRARQDTLDRRVEKMREVILKIMETAGVRTLPLTIATLSVKPNQHVIVTEADLIPEGYRRQPPWEAHKALIKASLKAGALVPGCVLSNPEPSLTIHMK